MKQWTLAAQSGFERYTKKTRRALFLEEMEQVVPWAELCALIEPVYPNLHHHQRILPVRLLL
jgi:IS5 family transposase